MHPFRLQNRTLWKRFDTNFLDDIVPPMSLLLGGKIVFFFHKRINLWGKSFRYKVDPMKHTDPRELGWIKSACAQITTKESKIKQISFQPCRPLNSSGRQVKGFFQQTIPVFCVIWRLVIICLHLGSITSLFLFCFKHCNIFFESASGQNRYKKNPNKQTPHFITKHLGKKPTTVLVDENNHLPNPEVYRHIPQPQHLLLKRTVLLSKLTMGTNLRAHGLSQYADQSWLVSRHRFVLAVSKAICLSFYSEVTAHFARNTQKIRSHTQLLSLPFSLEIKRGLLSLYTYCCSA